MNIGHKIAKLRGLHKLTQKELANKLKLSQSAIAYYEINKKRPSIETLQLMARIFNVNISYFLEESNGRTNHRKTSAPYLPPDAIPVGETIKVPILGEIRAGKPVFAEEHLLGYEEVPAKELKGSDHFYLVVKGDSMTGSNIYPGYKVLVRQQEYVENNEIAVVLVNNGEEATLKRVKYLDDTVLLYPDNPAYEAQVYKPDEVQVIGIVIKVEFKP